MENMISTKICNRCGACCKKYPFIELSKNETYLLEQATALHHDEFTNLKDKAVEEYFLQFQENGDCVFLNENNGRYSCGVYDARPEICRNYPSKPEQKEACHANRERSLRRNSS
jgi:Fe-S-cluster containining protein